MFVLVKDLPSSIAAPWSFWPSPTVFSRDKCLNLLRTVNTSSTSFLSCPRERIAMASKLIVLVLQLASCYAFRMIGRLSSQSLHHQQQITSVSVRPTPITTCTRLMMMSEGGDDSSRGLISVAKTFALTNLGASNPSLLTADFVCSGPDFVCGSKDTYVAGLTKETQVFQKAMPDFDLRPYGFMVDETSPDTVWFKIRPRGTITGPFVYKGEVYAPNNKVVELPIQQLSVTIRGGQVGRVTAGYIVDNQSGNTGGLAGPQGILYALGEKPSTFSYLPPAVALKQLFARTQKVPTRNAKSSPFPEPVMFSLAKRIVETSFGAEEPSLLTKDFQFTAPLIGPLNKDEHVQQSNVAGIKAALPNLQMDTYNYEIDQYDRDRVWFIMKSKGKQINALVGSDGKIIKEASEDGSYVSAPEAVSVSINDKGLCYRVTSGYILDKEIGNTKGLGGSLGLLEALGAGKSFLETRSLAEVPRLLKEAISPTPSTVKTVAPKASPAPAPAPAPVEKKIVAVKIEEKPVVIPPKPAPAVEQKPIVKPAPVVEQKPIVKAVASAPVKPTPQPPKPAAKAPEPPKKVEPVKPAATPAATPAPVKKVEAAPAGGFFSFLDSTPAPATPTKVVAKPVDVATKSSPAPAAKPAAPAVATPAVAAKAPEKFTPKVSVVKPTTTIIKPATLVSKAPEKTAATALVAPAKTTTTASPAEKGLIQPAKKIEPVKPAANAPEPPKKVEPVKPAATPAPVKKVEAAPAGGFFSFLGSSSAPATPAKPTPQPPKPAATTRTITSPAAKGLFQSAKKIEPVKPTPQPPKPAAKAPEPPKKVEPVKPAAMPAATPTPVKKDESAPAGGFFSFLGSSSAPATPAKPTPQPPKPAAKAPEPPKKVEPVKSSAPAFAAKPAPSKQVSPPPAAKQVSSPPPAPKIAPSPSKPVPQNTQSEKAFFIDDAKPQMVPKIQEVKPKGVTGPTIKIGKKISGKG